ncbi:23S rRNA pseudouridine(955/2504/2580) synthase RluC [Candidatus Curculioniphilus buchneri]|uniref:23S rRNA pseudouridine(955/2504/2580) synthase RluC n=1 Tax=Candidatus Curculioniphilus buchneri TaxID=690594 RepID=UPI00376EAA0B
MKSNESNVYFITISENESDQRIDNFLHKHLKGVPKSMVYRIMREGEVRVNKKRIQPKYKLQYGDEVRIPPLRQSKELLPIPINLTSITALNKAILYEDNFLLVLNKPSGIAVHGGSGLNFGIIECLRVLHRHTKFLELVHRLDRDTSGVLLLAKKRSVLCSLHEQLCNNRIKKDYLALVRGHWKDHVKTVNAPLLKQTLSYGKRIVQVNRNGKPSETHFKVSERFTLATLLKVNPITGRTHQIRVHSKHVGHPVAFDNRYGDKIFDQQLTGCGLNRLFLHATALQFRHPNSGKMIYIEAPLDASLHRCLQYLRQHFQ